jgi:hypothetical protein
MRGLAGGMVVRGAEAQNLSVMRCGVVRLGARCGRCCSCGRSRRDGGRAPSIGGGGSTMRTTVATGRDRARDRRLKAVQARRRALDPVTLAREQRIDEAVLELEDAWSSRRQALIAVERAESSATSAIQPLAKEGVPASDVAHLSGLELATVRRLRRRRQPNGDLRGLPPQAPSRSQPASREGDTDVSAAGGG